MDTFLPRYHGHAHAVAPCYADQLLRAEVCDGWSQFPHDETPVVLIRARRWYGEIIVHLCRHCYAALRNDESVYDVLAEIEGMESKSTPEQYQGELLETESCAGYAVALERIAEAQEELVNILRKALDILQTWHEFPPPLPKRGEANADQEEGKEPHQ